MVEEQKVMYTTYKLSDEAKQWWQAQADLLVMELGSEGAITWQWFKKYNDHFLPKVVKDAKAREFLDFVQGTMIVT